MYHGDLPTPGRKPGGVAVHVQRLSDALSRRGHDVTVLTFSDTAATSFEVDRLRPHRAEHSSLAREYLVPWLWNARSFDDYDVAHFHGDDWFFFRRRLPTVRTFHGSALREAQSATSWRRRIDKRVVFCLEMLASRLATGAYGVGADEARLYHADGLLPIGIELYAAADHRSPKPSVLFIGTWGGRKRGRLLYETFLRDVRPQIPDAELWMVSDECPTNPSVKWINAPSDAELGAALSAAWLFCLPSAYEGFGIPYLEAMAHGTPVVATPNPGSEALLGDGQFGVLSSEPDLGRNLVRLLNSATLREAFATNGRMRAAEYSWERCCVRHEEAYGAAMERWAVRRA
jgi:glycosyltransferase involved in cell wall biosynthesis